jgi:threonyl-tRNA synthetase
MSESTLDRPAVPTAADQPLTLVLPDGATRSVPVGTLPRDVVATIGERLLKAAVAVEVEARSRI